MKVIATHRSAYGTGVLSGIVFLGPDANFGTFVLSASDVIMVITLCLSVCDDYDIFFFPERHEIFFPVFTARF